jgi:hypothetical protein
LSFEENKSSKPDGSPWFYGRVFFAQSPKILLTYDLYAWCSVILSDSEESLCHQTRDPSLRFRFVQDDKQTCKSYYIQWNFRWLSCIYFI